MGNIFHTRSRTRASYRVSSSGFVYKNHTEPKGLTLCGAPCTDRDWAWKDRFRTTAFREWEPCLECRLQAEAERTGK